MLGPPPQADRRPAGGCLIFFRRLFAQNLLLTVSVSLCLFAVTSISVFTGLVAYQYSQTQKASAEAALPLGWVAVEGAGPVDPDRLPGLYAEVQSRTARVELDGEALGVAERAFRSASGASDTAFADYVEGEPPSSTSEIALTVSLRDILGCTVGCQLTIEGTEYLVSGTFALVADRRALEIHSRRPLDDSEPRRLIFENFEPRALPFDVQSESTFVRRSFGDEPGTRLSELSDSLSIESALFFLAIVGVVTAAVVASLLSISLTPAVRSIRRLGASRRDLVWRSLVAGGLWGVLVSAAGLASGIGARLVLAERLQTRLNQIWLDNSIPWDLLCGVVALVALSVAIGVALSVVLSFGLTSSPQSQGKLTSLTAVQRFSSTSLLRIAAVGIAIPIVWRSELRVVLLVVAAAGLASIATGRLSSKLLGGLAPYRVALRKIHPSVQALMGSLAALLLPLIVVSIGAKALVASAEEDSSIAAPIRSFVVSGGELSLDQLDLALEDSEAEVLRWSERITPDEMVVRVVDRRTGICLATETIRSCLQGGAPPIGGESSLVLAEVGFLADDDFDRLATLLEVEDPSNIDQIARPEALGGQLVSFDDLGNTVRLEELSPRLATFKGLGAWLPALIVREDSVESTVAASPRGGRIILGFETNEEQARVLGRIASIGPTLQVYYERGGYDSRVEEFARFGPVVSALSTFAMLTAAGFLRVYAESRRRLVITRLGVARAWRVRLGVMQSVFWSAPAPIIACSFAILSLRYLSGDWSLVLAAAADTVLAVSLAAIGAVLLSGLAFGSDRLVDPASKG